VKIALQTLASAVFGVLFFGLALFLPAWTFDYWQAWVFIAVFIASTIGPSLYLAVKNPAALQRRLRAGPSAETRPVQKVVILATVVSVIIVMVISALDHRFGWSEVPISVVVLGNVLVAVGIGLSQVVILQNNFASANIAVEDGQPLVSTGLYGVVRHPMYVGALVMMIGGPLALGSYWGLVGVFATVPVLAVRILDEEKMLTAELAGYDDYTRKVRYRMVPGVW
jgi:protein-S-isoprenylcysteine O-methyltransferase Ste14